MNRLQVRLSVALVAVLLAALTALSVRTSDRAETLILPEINHKAETVGRSVAGLVARAFEVGIPKDRLIGLDDYLQTVVDSHADLSFISVTDDEGDVLYSAGVETDTTAARVPLPIGDGESLYITVDLDPTFARDIVYKLWIDLAIVMVVTALVALELIYISFGVGLYGAIEGVEHRLAAIRRGDLRAHAPVASGSTFGAIARGIDERLSSLSDRFSSVMARLRQRGDDARLAALEAIGARFKLGGASVESPISVIAIRAPLFIFMFAEELTRPFLPIYIQDLASPIPGLSPEMVISLPMVLFLAIVAIAQPILGSVTERAGRRRSLMTGAALGAAGYVATAFAYDMIGLTLARAMTAVGFALVFVAAQGFVIDATTTRHRARGMAVFISAILVAGFCGPPIGGIVADRLGMESAFLMAGLLAAASLVLARMALPGRMASSERAPVIRWRDFAATFGSLHLTALLFLCALPAKLVLVAFCFFLIPLHMEANGHDQATIGRMLMIYPLAMVMLVPAFASWAEKADRRVLFVVGGGMIAGLGGLVVLADSSNVIVLAAMLLLLGIGQAMSIAPQSALVGEFGQKLSGISESSLYGIFRLVERTGNALGPIVAGALLGLYGFDMTVVVIGVTVAVSAFLFALTSATGASAGTVAPDTPVEGKAR